MTPDVYVLYKEGLPATRNLYDAWNGFRVRGHRVFAFDVSEIDLLTTGKQDIISAGIPVIQRTWRRLGVEIPSPINYPHSLQEFMHRKIDLLSIGNLRNKQFNGVLGFEDNSPIFIKPYDAMKSFTGFVLASTKGLFKISHLEDDTKLWVSQPINFLSEWRVYVLENEVLGIGNYSGNPLYFPDSKVITKMIDSYKESCPVAYGLDVGVIDDGSTALVEVNDSYSLGNYGLPSTLYAKMIEARWFEVVG